jgi:dTDP-4-dehydrorhamnose reductase
MKYAIIGVDGQVGQEFRKCLPVESVIPLTRGQIDVTDASSTSGCIEGLDCDVVVNLAAFHNVNECEEEPTKAFEVNAIGAGRVAQVAKRGGKKAVYFSSDYVFGQDADRRSPYLESDATGPLNAYGASKLAGEHLVRAAATDHLIVRTSSLFGVVTSKKGWTFPEMIINRATSGEPLKVVADQYMSPTYTLDLVRHVIALCEGGATGMVHITNGGGCSWHEFATATLEMAGIDYPIEAVSSYAFPSIARRPAYSRLDSELLSSLGANEVRDWKEGLKAYLTEKGVVD